MYNRKNRKKKKIVIEDGIIKNKCSFLVRDRLIRNDSYLLIWIPFLATIANSFFHFVFTVHRKRWPSNLHAAISLPSRPAKLTSFPRIVQLSAVTHVLTFETSPIDIYRCLPDEYVPFVWDGPGQYNRSPLIAGAQKCLDRLPIYLWRNWNVKNYEWWLMEAGNCPWKTGVGISPWISATGATWRKAWRNVLQHPRNRDLTQLQALSCDRCGYFETWKSPGR